MANTIQSVGRSLFNLISRVLISSIRPLAAIWLTTVTPSPAAKNPIFIKFVIPKKDQRCYLCWNKPRPSTACLMSGKLAEEAGGWLYTHQIHAHIFASSPLSCHERLLSHAAAFHLCSCSALLPTLVPPEEPPFPVRRAATQGPLFASYSNCHRFLL